MTIQSMSVTDAKDAAAKRCGPKIRIKLIIGLLIVLIALAAICGYYIGTSQVRRPSREPPDPLVAPLPSPSVLHVFQKGAVCTDAPQCSDIGRDILNKNGTAVDAAIAAMFCNGLLNQQSMGIGGGFFMTVYIKDEGRAHAVVAREAAPRAATRDMFHGDYNKASKGPLAVGVPGEVKGLWVAHKRWGALPWPELLAPTIELCRTGFNMSRVMYDALSMASYIVNDSRLRSMYHNDKTRAFHPPHTFVKPYPELCDTLERISVNGGDDFYTGSLAADIVADLRKAGSIVTAEDLARYQAKITDPIAVKLNDEETIYTPPPPSSGVLLAYIMNILRGYNFTSDSIKSTNETILTYHRIIEAFKYAYATRTLLGDQDYLNLTQLLTNITSPDFANLTRLQINDTRTSNDTATYGAREYTSQDAGTAHISIISPNGDAVSVTSSINYYFGAGFTTYKTGIVMNNVMDDFSSPGITNYFGLKPSPANFIAPAKRPLSSMSPSIVVDASGNARLLIGASGGTKITTAVALVAMRKLWFEQSIKQAVDAPRFHHQIFPMEVQYEYGLTEDVVNGLREKGHGMARYRSRGSIVCALYRNRTGIYANADFRKGGDVRAAESAELMYPYSSTDIKAIITPAQPSRSRLMPVSKCIPLPPKDTSKEL